VGDVARAAGAINRAMRTMQQALGTASTEATAALLSSADNAPLEAGGGAVTGVQHGRQLPAGWRGEIEFQNVGFSHPGGWAIKDLSFKLPAGSTVALVGPRCGAAHLICRGGFCMLHACPSCCLWKEERGVCCGAGQA
jgi:ABC-type multidrug transport system fused ATPase/permease subunit